MGELDHLSWRDKLERLRQLPRPSEPSYHTSMQNLHKILSNKSVKKLNKPNPQEYMQQKLMEYSAGYPRASSMSGGAPVHHHVSPVPDCLNTFSDFYNPGVSTEEKFDKYLVEMERKDIIDEITPHIKAAAAAASARSARSQKSSGSSSDEGNNKASGGTLQPKKIVLDELRCSLTRERQLSSDATPKRDDKRYTPGSKGGGWKVLPQICSNGMVKFYKVRDGEVASISSPSSGSSKQSTSR